MKWMDVTSYSRGDKERKPTAWRLNSKVLDLTVVFGHRDLPGKWCFHCHALNFNTQPLEAQTLEEAKTEALILVTIRLEDMLEAVRKA
jgi:hypothetical protein